MEFEIIPLSELYLNLTKKPRADIYYSEFVSMSQVTGFYDSTSRMTYIYVCVESWMSAIPRKVDAKNRKSMTSYQSPFVFYVPHALSSLPLPQARFSLRHPQPIHTQRIHGINHNIHQNNAEILRPIFVPDVDRAEILICIAQLAKLTLLGIIWIG